MQSEIQKPQSIIQVLASGFELIIQNPWVIVFPIALDLLIWLGPQISVKPLFDHLIAFINANAVLPPNVSPETTQNFELIKEALQAAGDSFNLLGVIATGIPSLFWIEPPASAWNRIAVFGVADGLTLFALLILLALVGILLTAVYFELLGRAVRHDVQPNTFVPRTLKGFATIFALVLGLGVAMIVILLPISLGATVLSLFSQELSSMLVLLASLFFIWAMLYLAFALPAIFVSGANAVQAVLQSISLFRFDFWSSMGLIVLAYLIRWGFAFVWQMFWDTPAGILFDVIANAFLGSGLTAAILVFYADRINWLNQIRERIRQVQFKG
jgi:hypothetical protein